MKRVRTQHCQFRLRKLGTRRYGTRARVIRHDGMLQSHSQSVRSARAVYRALGAPHASASDYETLVDYEVSYPLEQFNTLNIATGLGRPQRK